MVEQNAALCLIADIGGTNTRFALARAGRMLAGSINVLKTAQFASLEDAARHYLKLQAQTVHSACFAVAGPVSDDGFRITNGHWRGDTQQLCMALQLEQVQLINDFEAIALALPQLDTTQLIQIGDNGQAPAAALSRYCTLVIGPGTGFGSACLIPAHGSHIAIAGEGGHAALAPEDAQELALLGWLQQHDHANAREAFLSGPGIELLHRALCELERIPQVFFSAEDIVRHALQGETQCQRTLSRFCSWLGATARDQVLNCGTRGGVYIAGGVVPHFAQFLLQSTFRARFEHSVKMHDYLRAIPTFLITEPNPGLIGAAWHSIQRNCYDQ